MSLELNDKYPDEEEVAERELKLREIIDLKIERNFCRSANIKGKRASFYLFIIIFYLFLFLDCLIFVFDGSLEVCNFIKIFF